jgi:hypothetical protein
MDPTDQHIVGCHCHQIEEAEKSETQSGLFSSMFSKVKVMLITELKSIFSTVKPINSYAKYKLNNEDPYTYNSIYEDRLNSIIVFFEKVNELVFVY